MKTPFGHLTYCTNIHAGESWEDHFAALKTTIPLVKEVLSPSKPFGIGLRLSQRAASELAVPAKLIEFKKWLLSVNSYVFTMNGFPYGGFHHTRVKDNVHKPDWTTPERVAYTIQLFQLLAELLPAGTNGGISTSPLSYRHWLKDDETKVAVFETATHNILRIVEELVNIKKENGCTLHLDIEPEPDGLLESGPEFIQWYNDYLIPRGANYFAARGRTREEAITLIQEHIQLCYDICHFAVGYENHREVLDQLKANHIRVGKIQISAALKAAMDNGKFSAVAEALTPFNESTYLHQVVARKKDNTLMRYPDLTAALAEKNTTDTVEWRSHFHVPLFVENYGILESTQTDIREVLDWQKREPFTSHLEIETYTWEVLPEALRLPLKDSIIRELNWVKDILVK